MINFTIRNIEYNLNDTNNLIEFISLCGSSARGDDDSLSDIDFFVVIDDCNEESFISTKKWISETLNIPINWISQYRKSSIVKMHEYGSYFLWHIKLEGKTIFSRSGFVEELLRILPPYNRVKEDLTQYLEICNDIKQSIKQDNVTISYELAVLAH
jgi:predicted nucleotidyltransferase